MELLPKLIQLLASNCFPVLMAIGCGYIIRQRYFHPLSKFPGPFLASITNLWRMYDYSTQTQHINDFERHKRYGPVFRDGPNSLSFSNPKALESIYNSHQKKEFTKSTWYWAFPVTTDDRDVNHFMARYPTQAGALKKNVARLYDMKTALEYESRMEDHILKWLDKTEQLETIDIVPWCHYLALDIIAEIFYGELLGDGKGFIEQGHDINGHIESIESMMYVMSLMGPVSSITKIIKGSIFGRLLKPDPNAKTGYMKSFGFCHQLVDSRLSQNTKGRRKNFMDYIIDQVGKGSNHMTKEVAVGESIISIMAGSDSVAAALIPIIHLLARHRHIYAKVQQEIDAATVTRPVVKYNETLKLKYFCAAVREAMRLYPSFGSTWPRIVPEGGREIVPGIFVPGGTDVGITSYVTNRDTAIFGEDAEEFRPERWLDIETERRAEMDKYYATFSYKYSARICSGQNIAMVEIHKFFFEFIKRFDFNLVHPERPLEGKNNIQIFYENIPVSLKRRE